MRGDNSPNHQFMIETAITKSGSAKPVVLDFGCGTGALIAKALAAGIDAYGVDSYSGAYGTWQSKLHTDAVGRVAVANGTLPFANASFDAVISNFVFEHMPWESVAASLREIRRVLKEDGTLIAAFPTHETWFEGHCGIYFAHRVIAPQRYLRACHSLGFGLYRDGTSQEWAQGTASLLKTIHFHRRRQFFHVVRAIFGKPPKDIGPEFIRFRVGGKNLPDWFLRFVCAKRVGYVMAV